MDSKKTVKSKAKKETKTKKSAAVVKATAAQATAAPAKKAAKNFLFSVPSWHTNQNDYEHLVIAPTKEEACRLLAEHRVTEKRPDLEGEPRSSVVSQAAAGYCKRAVEQIEARKEAAGVVAINHHKLGLASNSLN